MLKVEKYDVDTHCEAVYLYVVEGLNQEDIAEMLGIETGWNYTSRIIKAYNFNKTRGSLSILWNKGVRSICYS